MKIRSIMTETEARPFDGSAEIARAIAGWANGSRPGQTPPPITIDGDRLIVATNNGPAIARPGDYVIAGPSDFYPCDPVTFAKRWDESSTTRHPPSARNSDEAIDRRFAHHPPKGDQGQRYGEIRAHLRETAKFIRDRTPESPEQTRAINALHEAMMLANAAIACNE